MRSSSAPSCRTKAASRDRKSTRLNSSHLVISYAVFCLKKKKQMCTALNFYYQRKNYAHTEATRNIMHASIDFFRLSVYDSYSVTTIDRSGHVLTELLH